VERRNIRTLNERGRVKELYQRLFRRAMSFLSRRAAPGSGRIMHTEITVERQGVTVLLSGVRAADFDTCPLCGQKLGPTQAAQVQSSLRSGTSSQYKLPGDVA
jgi:hypothetical protein